MRKTIAASVFVLLFCVGQAKAAGQFSLYAGYMNPGNLNLESLQEGYGLRGSGHYGARAEFDFLTYFGIEQNIGFSPRLVRSYLFPDQASDVRAFFYSTNFMINIPYRRFVPYVTFGFRFMKPWGSGFSLFGAKFTHDYGGGFKLNRLAGPFGLRFDARGWRTADIAGQGGAWLLDVSGGLTYSWGGK